MSEKEPQKTNVFVQKVTIDEIVHLTALKVARKLEMLEERIMDIEIFLTTENAAQKEESRIRMQEKIAYFKETLNGARTYIKKDELKIED